MITGGATLASLIAAAALGSVVETADRDGWFGAAGPVTTIGFARFPDGTFITDQYEELGVLFLDGDDNAICCGPTFPQDGAGLDGNAAIHLLFSSPQRWIAADFPGDLQFQLFFEGQLFYQQSLWFGGSGVGSFGGLLSTAAFDEAIVTDPFDDQVNFDDLHFGGLPVGDLDFDGEVGIADFLALVGAWGPCPAPCPKECLVDLDGNDAVGIDDFLVLLAAWGPNPGHPADFDGDGVVGIVDFLALLANWGPCPVLFPPTCNADLDGDCGVGITDFLILLGNWG